MKASHLILLGALFTSAGAWAQSHPQNSNGSGTSAADNPSQAGSADGTTVTNGSKKPTGKMTSKQHSKAQGSKGSRNASGTSTGGTDAGGNSTHPNTGDAVNNPGMSGTGNNSGNNSGTDSSNMGNSGNTTSTPPGQQK